MTQKRTSVARAGDPLDGLRAIRRRLVRRAGGTARGYVDLVGRLSEGLAVVRKGKSRGRRAA